MKTNDRYLLIKSLLDSGKYSIDINTQEVYSKYKSGMLKQFLTHDGYVYVTFTVNRKQKFKVKIHQLIAIALGWNIVGFHINHKDGVKRNNHPNNLEVVTQSENEKHAYKLGLKTTEGIKNANAKLTENDVKCIRSDYEIKKNYISQRELAKQYNVTQSVISNIVNHKRWSHVKEGKTCW
jgi:hypothetical protein